MAANSSQTKFGKLAVALRNLKRNTFRTTVLVSAIAILVALLIFATFFTMSVSATIEKASDRLGADLLIVPVGARDSAEEFLLESKQKSFHMPKEILSRVEKIEGIESLTHQTYLETISGACCDVVEAQIIAFDQKSDFIVKPWLQNSIGRALGPGEAIAGVETYENLGLELLEVEKTIFNKRFKIVGVLERTGTGLDNAIFMTEADLEQIVAGGNSPLKQDQISIIFAKIGRDLDPYHVGLDVEGNIIEVDVVTRREMGSELLRKLSDINKIFVLSTVMGSILTVFLVWAIFSAIANERASEIGIMRAVGASESHIVRLFILEVVLLGVLGSLIGTALGTYLFMSLTKSFTLLRDLSVPVLSFRPLPAYLMQQTVIGAASIAVGTGICIAGALGPINWIKRLEPHVSMKGSLLCRR